MIASTRFVIRNSVTLQIFRPLVALLEKKKRVHHFNENVMLGYVLLLLTISYGDEFISWRILSSRSPYNSASKRCNLCLKEKLLIIRRPELSSLNKRKKLVSSCRRRNKALLRNNWTKHRNLPPRLLCKFVKYINDGTNILNNKIPWVNTLGRMSIVLATFTCNGENVLDL